MKRRSIIIGVLGFAFLYLGTCLVFYLCQEHFGFKYVKLPSDYIFKCDKDYKEININTTDAIKLNGVLVKADSSKGLILFLHGSGGNIERYLKRAPIYTQLGYDIFLLDYRGYGKSEGKMKNEKQFIDDLDCVYSYFKSMYKEENIVIIGFSMGTMAGSVLASKNNPRLLVLEAPPYNIIEQFEKKFWFLPVSFMTKYKFETYKYVKTTKVPIAVFHGREDPLSKDLRWKQVLKPDDKLTILEGEGHDDFALNSQYIKELNELLK
jgi:pimeloyl-ACP methyl ester carboxylesterase